MNFITKLLIFLIEVLGLQLLNDEKLLIDQTNNLIQPLNYYAIKSNLEWPIHACKIYNYIDSFKVFVLVKKGPTHNILVSETRLPYFIDGIPQVSLQFFNFSSIIDSGLECNDFTALREKIMVLCFKQDRASIHECQAGLSCHLLFRWDIQTPLKQMSIVNISDWNMILLLDHEQFIEVKYDFSQSDQSQLPLFEEQENVEKIFVGMDFIQGAASIHKIRENCVIDLQYLVNYRRKQCFQSQQHSEEHLRNRQIVLTVGESEWYQYEGETLPLKFHQSHRAIAISHNQVLIYNETFLYFNKMEYSYLIKQIIPVVSQEIYAILNEHVSLIEANHFRNYISKGLSQVQIETIRKGEVSEDLNLTFAKFYVPAMQLGEQQQDVRHKILSLAETITHQIGAVSFELRKTSNVFLPCGQKRVVYSKYLRKDRWLLQVEEKDSLTIIYAHCIQEVQINNLTTFKSNQRLRDDLVASFGEALIVVQDASTSIINLIGSQRLTFSNSINSILAQPYCLTLVVLFPNGATKVLNTDLQESSKDEANCLWAGYELKCNKQTLLISDRLHKGLNEYRFVTPIVRCDILDEKNILIWFHQRELTIVQYYRSEHKIYEIKELPLLGYVPETEQRVQYGDDSTVSILAYNAEGERRLLVYALRNTYQQSLLSVIPVANTSAHTLENQTAFIRDENHGYTFKKSDNIYINFRLDSYREDQIHFDMIQVNASINSLAAQFNYVFILIDRSAGIYVRNLPQSLVAPIDQGNIKVTIERFVAGHVLEIKSGVGRVHSPINPAVASTTRIWLKRPIKSTIIAGQYLLVVDMRLEVRWIFLSSSQSIKVPYKFQHEPINIVTRQLELNGVFYGMMVYQYHHLTVFDTIRLVLINLADSTLAFDEELKIQTEEIIAVITYQNIIVVQSRFDLWLCQGEKIGGKFMFSLSLSQRIEKRSQIQLVKSYLLVSWALNNCLSISTYNLSDKMNNGHSALSAPILLNFTGFFEMSGIFQNYDLKAHSIYAIDSRQGALQFFILIIKDHLAIKVRAETSSSQNGQNQSNFQLVSLIILKQNPTHSLNKLFTQDYLIVQLQNSQNKQMHIQYYNLNQNSRLIYLAQVLVVEDCKGTPIDASQNYIVFFCEQMGHLGIIKSWTFSREYQIALDSFPKQIPIEVIGQENRLHLKVQIEYNAYLPQLCLIMVFFLILISYICLKTKQRYSKQQVIQQLY